MRIDKPTCKYGEENCKKHSDGNCLLKPDLLDERCPIRRTIDDVLEIIDKVIEGQMKQADTFNGNGCHALAKTHQDQACGAQIAKQAVLRLKEGKE